MVVDAQICLFQPSCRLAVWQFSSEICAAVQRKNTHFAIINKPTRSLLTKLLLLTNYLIACCERFICASPLRGQGGANAAF